MGALEKDQPTGHMQLVRQFFGIVLKGALLKESADNEHTHFLFTLHPFFFFFLPSKVPHLVREQSD